MPEHNILELILFYSIPRRDVKEVAYNLINHFDGDLGRVFGADIDELKNVKGVGENSAILISLFKEVNKVLLENKNREKRVLNDYYEIKDYVQNCLSRLKNEKIILITLNNSCEIISNHSLSEGTVSCVSIEPKKIVEYAIRDNASSVILAHNHPDGSFIPSEEDVEFTAFIYRTLKAINIGLKDHIIVGENGALSMNNDARYVHCFM